MILSSTTSSSPPTKMPTPDDSPVDEEHEWESYLIETKSEAAPACNFRQTLIPPVNDFNVGDKLETIDPRNQDSWCIGTIIEKDGPRLRIRLDGTDDRNDFWRLVDSSDIRCYGTTAKFGGQIVPPLGFQQNSTRWAKYFEKNVQNGPFAFESCFKPQPNKPEKNLFKRGQKLEAVDPKHPQVICPATVNNVLPGDHRIVLSLDGWSSSNNFKIDYGSRDIFPVGWCRLAGCRLAKAGGNHPPRTSNKTSTTVTSKPNGSMKSKKPAISPSSGDSSYSPTVIDDKNNNSISRQKSSRTLNVKQERRISIDFDGDSIKKEEPQPIVTAYLNYTGDNSGMLLNPHKFRFLMPTRFGPAECHLVLTSLFDSCIKCAFQQASFIDRITHLFPSLDGKDSTDTHIKLENGTVVHLSQLKTEDDFWEVIRTFQNAILAGHDLFISTPPPPVHSQSNDSSSSFLDSSASPDKKELSPSHRSMNKTNSSVKRKSEELVFNRTFDSNGKVPRSNSIEKSVHESKLSISSSISQQHPNGISSKPTATVPNGGTSSLTSRRPERYTPSEVAAFIRRIDPSFDSLASRFLQEEIDGKALLLLSTDTLMRHMGLKLGPSLKIVHHIEQLKKNSS